MTKLADDFENEDFGNDKLAKRKKIQRNRDRQLKYKFKLLDHFANQVSLGYTDEGWANVSDLYNQISDFVTPDERKRLGQIWRETYTADVLPTKISDTVSVVKARLAETQR